MHCPSHEPNAMSLASHITYFGSSLVICHSVITGMLLLSSLHRLNACECLSVHLQVRVVHCKSVIIAAVLAKFGRNLDNEFSIALTDCNCLILVGSGTSKICCTLCRYAERPSGVQICLSMSKRLVKNWDLVSLHQNCWSCRCRRTFRKVSTCRL